MLIVVWFWFACTGIAGLIVGFLVGAYLGASGARHSTTEALGNMARNLASDRDFLLRVLRRELANWMLRRDPDRYLRVYRAAHEAEATIRVADRSEQQIQFGELTKQYPFYQDFDLLGTREHVLYADVLSTNSYEEVERHYTDIIRFQSLQIVLDGESEWKRATSDDDLAHLEEYVRQFKDTRFKNRLKDALSEFYAYRRGMEAAKSLDANQPLCETAAFSVYHVPHFAENRYGIHFKDTDEYALYGFFYSDKMKLHEGFYRSNATFDKEIVLDALLVGEPV